MSNRHSLGVAVGIFFFASAIHCIAQPGPELRWYRAHGGGTADYCYAVCGTSSDGLLIAGATLTHIGAQQADLRVACVDSAGNLLWLRTYGLPEYDEVARAITQDSDGGFLVVGERWTQEEPRRHSQLWILRLAATGDTLETRLYDYDMPYALSFGRSASDDEWIVIVRVQALPDTGYHSIALYFSNAADTVRSVPFDTSTYADLKVTSGFAAMPDGLVTIGQYWGPWKVRRLDVAYGVVWEHELFRNRRLAANVIVNSLNRILVCGRKDSYTSENNDGFVTCFGAEGDSLWNRDFGDSLGGDSLANEQFTQILETREGNLIAAGQFTRVISFETFDGVFVTKLDSVGTPLWSRYYGDSSRSTQFEGIVELSDGSFMMAGTTRIRDSNNYDFFVMRTEPDGLSAGTPPQLAQSFSLSQNFPNPFNPVTEIVFSLPKETEITLRVFDVLGREVADLANGRMSAGEHRVVFDGTLLGAGVYFYRLEAPGVFETRKMLLLK